MLPALDQLVENDAGDGPVRHAVSRITRGNVDVLVGPGILPDIGEVIHGLHDLSRPAIVYALDHGEAFPRPFLEAAEWLLVIVGIGLAGLVILSTDDEDLVIGFLTGRILERLESDVVIGVRRVPVQSVRDRAFRNTRTDHISPRRCLLAVNYQPVIDGSIGADDDVVGADDVTLARGDFGGDSIHDFFGVYARIDLATIAQNRARESLQILERMKGRLAWKPQRDTRVPEIQWRPLHQLGVQ